MGMLAKVAFAQNRYGHNPFHHNEDFLGLNETKFMQTKGGAGRPKLDTTERLFGSTLHVERPERTQHLRNEDLGGRKYNHVNLTQIHTAPSTAPERKSERRFMQHRSQQSLERGRNLQGWEGLVAY